MAVLLSVAQTLAIIIAVAITIEGYLLKSLKLVERMVAFIAIPLLLLNPYNLGILGAALVLGIFLLQLKSQRAESVGV
ncbi:TRAP-type transport system [Vibrio ishigakensis]|uniref:TRAP-type transport system n=1 Tax=Vibrio ishigakensis TaxID=1481914 RepID=A0A0B8Q2B2_9VIBR|nr:TRAP-type transport system [Vibrio ishigakensis]